MGQRLFVRVYLTVVATIALVGLGAALVFGLALRDGIGPDRRDIAFTLRDATGAVVAAHGDPGDAPGREETIVLSDGGTLTLLSPGPFRGPGGAGPLFPLLGVLVFAALIAWPAVAQVTGRIERLRAGVTAWGEGDLTRRIPVEGRDEIAALAQNFNGAADRIEALVAAHRALLANASHELRSPLARLALVLGLIEDTVAPRHREEIARNLAELDALVGEILLASRLDHEAPLLTETIDLFAIALEEASREGIEAQGASAPVTGDSRLVARLVRNLVENARKHGAPPIDVTVERRGERAFLTVADHGPGLSASDRDRIFEPFYRPAGHGEGAGGWGLGLALVDRIARRHRGTLEVRTGLGQGLAITVAFPSPDELKSSKSFK